MIDGPAALRALRKAHGSIKRAALKLKVAERDLADFTRANPDLMNRVLEHEERALDRAFATLMEGLRSENPIKRRAAAQAMLKSRRAKRRGFGRSTKRAEPKPEPVVIRWQD
jgi:hypothetical protein